MLRLSTIKHCILAGCLPLALGACMNLPSTGPQQSEVLRAAKEVIISEKIPADRSRR